MKLLLLKMKFLWLCIQRKQYVYIFVNFLAFVDRFGKSVTFCLNIGNGDAILRKCVLASHSVQVYLLPVMVYQVLMEMNSYPYCSLYLSETVLHMINRTSGFQRGCSFAHIKVGFKIVTMEYDTGRRI